MADFCPQCGRVGICYSGCIENSTCSDCNGEGWYLDHEDECYENGRCNCTGVQVWCERCRGTGTLAA